MRRFLLYNSKLKERAKRLRYEMTDPEKKLWFEYLGHLPLRVRPQHMIDNFIVDFYIASKKLVIEIDGESHFTESGTAYDTERSAILAGLGLRVLRFTNREVMENFEGVCEEIEKYL